MIAAETALSRAPFAEITVGANRVALLKDGYQTFPAMLHAAREAKSTLCLETYILVDDDVAFTGGLNLSNDYAAIEDGGHGWRDTHVRVEGPAALGLQRMFIETWKRHRGARLDEARYARSVESTDARVRFIGNEFRKDRKHIRTAYVKAFARATSRIRVTNSYFMPPSRVLKALMRSARHGVDVQLIIAGSTDVP